MARLVAQKLSEALGQQFYVENHGGASGNIGTVTVANAPADGYTLLFAASDFVVQPAVRAKAPFDPIRSFAPVTVLAASPEMIAVAPTVPAKNLQELIAFLRANPGKHSYASPGAGSSAHLEGEWLYKITYGLDVVHVPFQGAAPAITSTIAGHTSIVHLALPALAPSVRDGKLRAVVVTGGKRSPEFPDVPTFAESGLTEFRSSFFIGAVAPAATAKSIVDLLYRQIGGVLKLADIQDRLKKLGFEPVGNTPDEFAAKIKADTELWAKIVRQANIKIE
jgi:tripartite-type tricarboxylate transporter receptor subunit TctC